MTLHFGSFFKQLVASKLSASPLCYSARQGNSQWKNKTVNVKKLSSNCRLWKQGWAAGTPAFNRDGVRRQNSAGVESGKGCEGKEQGVQQEGYGKGEATPQRSGDLVTKDIEKAKTLQALFSSFFARLSLPKPPRSWRLVAASPPLETVMGQNLLDTVAKHKKDKPVTMSTGVRPA